MFAKSKRFQEGAKDYIPGPGEYNIPTNDELSKHKRYGFLNQTTRFNGEGPVEISPDFFTGDNSTSAASLSSETRFSTSSSNKTEDARTKRQISELAAQFEKYRHTMQKEIDSLQLKNRKMETTIQNMTLEKENSQAIALKKDQELASIRQENTSLQKSMSRQEKNIDKSPKVIRLQKRLDQMENELDVAKDALIKAQQVAEEEKRDLLSIAAEKDEAIITLETQLETQSTALVELQQKMEKQQQHHDDVQEKDQQLIHELRTQLDETMCKLTAAHETLDQKEQETTVLKGEIEQQQQQLNDVCTAKMTLQTELETVKVTHENECQQWQSTQQTLQQDIDQLHQTLEQKTTEITQLASQLAKSQQEIQSIREKLQDQQQELEAKDGLVQKLHVRFDTYHRHVTQVMHEMKERMKSKDPTVEMDRLTKELLEAKKFINRQALNLDALKSELHWMSKWNRQLNQLIEVIHQDDIAHGLVLNTSSSSSSCSSSLSFSSCSSVKTVSSISPNHTSSSKQRRRTSLNQHRTGATTGKHVVISTKGGSIFFFLVFD
ncbi:hypothetical protein BDA99DRAFT_152291 [Phascolomyces articulosus]|uniref:Uncharacterized protein n=1 Tax=Phascolomyces articulosus TaxID=60185 RepID=A0AAD5K424_9FUNG|nr:hypothetical protein BDA99DRAFT_152291 [Phascolomyces articulosus]